MSARLVFEARAKCQDSVARCKDDGIFCEIDRLFCSAKTTISVRQSKSIKDREIGKQFAPLWRVLAEQFKILFPDGDDKGALLPQRSTPAHKSSASRIEETASENPCSNLFLLELDCCLFLLHLICAFLVFLVKFCNGSSLKPAHRFFAAWRVEAPVSAISRFVGFYTLHYR